MATTNEIFRLVFSGDTKGLTTSLTAGEAEMQASVQRIAGMMTGAATAITTAGVAASIAWDDATKTIVDGTGATGEVLDSLLESYQGVARFGPDAATAIADLNTHTGRTGPLLEQLAEKSLKAGLDTAVLGGSIRRFNLVGGEQEALIDKLIVAGQSYGANTNSLQTDIGKYGGELEKLGLSMDEQIALVAVAQSENSRLRTVVRELKDGTGGWMEKMQAAVPVIRDSTGATESAYETGKRWRDVLSETTSAMTAAVGPYGDLIGGIGSVATVALGFLTAFPPAAGVVGTAAKVMWGALGGPIGWIALGIAALAGAWVLWGDEIKGFLSGVWNSFVGVIEGALDWLRPFASYIGITLPENLGSWKIATDEVTEANESAEPAVAALDTSAAAMASTMTAEVAPGVAAAKEEIKAFDLATVNLKGQIQQAMPEIRNIGDLLEASGVQAGAAVLPWGFFADEVSTDVPNAMDIVMDSIMEVPPTAEQVAQQLRVIAPTWGQVMMDGLKSTWSPANVGNTLAAAFEGGGDYKGAISSLGAQSGAQFGESLSGALSKKMAGPPGIGGILGGALGVALPMIGPLLGQAAEWITGKLFGLFDKPSPAVVAARGMMQDFADQIELDMSDTSTSDRMADWMAGGFTESHARIVTFFQNVALAQGQSAEAGVEVWLRYQAAVEAGNQELADSIMAGQQEIWDSTQAGAVAAAEAATQVIQEQLEAAEAAQAEQLEGLKKQQALELGMLEHQKDEALGALKEMLDARLQQLKADQEARLNEMKAAQEAELDELRSARQEALGVVEAAIQRELEEERIKVRLRLDLQAAGNDEEAIAAAHARATESEERLADNRAMAAAMEEAEALIRAAHQAELDKLTAHWDEKEALVVSKHELQREELEWDQLQTRELMEEDNAGQILLMEEHYEGEELMLRQHHAKQVAEMQAGFAKELEAVQAGVAAINAASAQLQDRTVTITTVHQTVGSPGGGGGGFSFGGGRAHGGPVEEGKFYTVGEEGPERFYPGQDGTIVPGGGGVTPEAIRRALEGMELRMSDVDRVVMERMPDLAERVL